MIRLPELSSGISSTPEVMVILPLTWSLELDSDIPFTPDVMVYHHDLYSGVR
jgi:hypothetical protein